MSNQLRNDAVRFCPICKSDLTAETSNSRPATDSTRYRCTSTTCARIFEINDHTDSVSR